MTISAPVLSGSRLANAWTFRTDPTRLFVEAMRVGAPLVQVPVGPTSVFVACDMETVNEVFLKKASVFAKRTRGAALLRVVVGTSMLTAEGDLWKQRRKLAQPSFAKAAIRGFAEGMERAAADLADRWAVSDKPIAVDEATMDLALRVVCEALFGADLGPERSAIVHRGLTDVLSAFIPLVATPLPSPERWPIPAAWRLRGGIAELDRVVDAIVADRRAMGGGGDDLLGRLMREHDEGEKLDDKALRDELVTLLLAGHETTANALSWTLALLSKDPEAARRLEAEVDGIEGSVADAHTPWLDAVIKESMRLYPPAWILARAATEDTEIAGVAIPKGSFVFASTYALHRGPWFENPEGFDPERWISGTAERANWIPFGVGARKCIGEGFAMLEARIALAAIVRKVKMELVPGQELIPDPSVTLRPKGNLWMRARSRTGLIVREKSAVAAEPKVSKCPYTAVMTAIGAK